MLADVCVSPGWTPLIVACWEGKNPDVVKHLLEQKADTEAKNETGAISEPNGCTIKIT